MNIDRPNIKHLWQYLLVLGLTTLVVCSEIFIADVRKGLIGTPLLLIVIIASIFFDAYAGMLSVLAGTAGIFLITYVSAGYTGRVPTETIEFIIAGSIIYVLAERARSLSISNLDKEQTIRHLEKTTKRMKSQMNINKKDLQRLNNINSDLRHVVDDIMEDQQLWSEGVKKEIKKKDEKKSQV